MTQPYWQPQQPMYAPNPAYGQTYPSNGFVQPQQPMMIVTNQFGQQVQVPANQFQQPQQQFVQPATSNAAYYQSLANGMAPQAQPQQFYSNAPTIQSHSPFAQQQNPIYSAQAPTGTAYPAFFAAKAMIQPNQAEAMLNAIMSGTIQRLTTNGIGARVFGADAMAMGVNGDVFAPMLADARKLAQILLMDRTTNREHTASVSWAVNTMVYGKLAEQIGGPAASDFKQYCMATGVQLDKFFKSYQEWRANPNMYMNVIQKIAQGFAQQSQAPQGFATAPGMQPAPLHQITSQVGNIASDVPDALDIMAQRNHERNAALLNGQQPQQPAYCYAEASLHNPIRPAKEIPDGLDPYELRDYLERKEKAQKAAQLAEDYFDTPPITNAPLQTPTIGSHTHTGVGSQTSPQAVHTSPNGAVLPAGKKWPAEANAPTHLNDALTGNNQISSPVLAQPTQEHGYPTTGLPTQANYKFGRGEPVEEEDFFNMVDEHQFNSVHPEQHSTFNDEIANSFDEDEKYAQLIHEQEALAAAKKEQNRQETERYGSMQDMVNAAAQHGAEVKPIHMELDWFEMPPAARQSTATQSRIRRVPCYFKRKQHILLCNDDGKITLLRTEIKGNWMDYAKHETHLHKVDDFAASWDNQSRNLEIAKEHIAASTDKVWNAQFFVDKLNEALKDKEDRNERDVELATLVSERPIIKFEEVLPCSPSESEYQIDVVSELISRGVEDAATVSEQAIINYGRFETSGLVVNAENKALFNSVANSSTASDVVENIQTLKANATIPIRDIGRVIKVWNKFVNYYLAIDFGIGWSTDNALADLAELTIALVKQNFEQPKDAVVSLIDGIYTTAAKQAFLVLGNEEATTGVVSSVTLLPFYYSQYPLAKSDSVAFVDEKQDPELVKLLDLMHLDDVVGLYKLVTLDNVVLTFVNKVDSKEYYLVDVAD